MSQHFRRRGYDETLMTKAYKRDRKLLLIPKPKQSDSRVTFVSEYFTYFTKQVKKIVNKHWKLLECDPSPNHLSALKPRLCFKRGKNIRDMVVSSTYIETPKTKWLAQQVYGNYRCGKCAHCSHTFNIKTFSHPHSDKKYHIK